MFDTQRFIFEVQNRPCIWDSKQKFFSNRVVKKRAWEEIAKIFDPGWDEETAERQQEFVEELQKKWKHIRDYYVRLKKGKGRASPSAKRTNNSYIEYLRFLDVKKEPGASGNTSAQEDVPVEFSAEDEDDPLHSSTEEDPGTTTNDSSMIHLEDELIAARNSDRQEDADTKFLLSLLPQVRSLNERQNCEFKMEVMNLLYKIKYRSPYTYQRSGNILKKRKRLVNN